MRKLLLLLACLMAPDTSPAEVQTPDLSAAFGVREGVLDATLSPDGNRADRLIARTGNALVHR